jgi:UDP-N-acetylglucosamine diphosphorylase/glucosamine-1-phosphate N-acetyltransferase
MKYILFDDNTREALKPLSYTRPIAELRVGILCIKEKWEKRLDATCSYLTEGYLQKKYACISGDDNILINAKILPNEEIIEQIKNLNEGESIASGDTLLAIRSKEISSFNPNADTSSSKQVEISLDAINNTYDIFSLNEKEISNDFFLITKGRESQKLSSTVNRIGKYPIFLEEGASAEFCTLNTKNGPIYIGKEAEIMEGVLVRGPLAMCEHSVLKMAAKVYGATTLGPHCKCGGELNNVVFTGYSNKGHDGFLGNAVIGEWCNLGADTNNSNLKNTYDQVKLWDYKSERFAKTGLQFCGLIMGDHSKTGINTMINTGTVFGVGCNIYGSDFPRNFVPSYSWGGASGYKEHMLPQFFKTADAVMKRRSKDLDQIEKDILTHVFEESSKYRNY